MELAVRAAAVGITAAIISLFIKRTNPELSAVFSLAVTAVLSFAALTGAAAVVDVISRVRKALGGTETYLVPVIKCTAIGMITRLSSELCRETAQNSIAAAVELAGSLCAFAVAAPLIINMLEMIGDMV